MNPQYRQVFMPLFMVYTLMHNGYHNRDIVCLVISDIDLKFLFCSSCLALTQNQADL